MAWPLIERNPGAFVLHFYGRAILVLADLIRAFCNEPENNYYDVYENYSGRVVSGEKTIGIVVKQDHNYLEMLEQLTRYLETKGFDDPLMELEGAAVDALGSDIIVYFPAIQDYHPLG